MDKILRTRFEGDAAGVQVTRSNVGAWGGELSNDGIWLEDCGGAAPWIASNDWIASEGDSQGLSLAVGIRSVGDCHPLIEGNREKPIIYAAVKATRFTRYSRS